MGQLCSKYAVPLLHSPLPSSSYVADHDHQHRGGGKGEAQQIPAAKKLQSLSPSGGRGLAQICCGDSSWTRKSNLIDSINVFGAFFYLICCHLISSRSRPYWSKISYLFDHFFWPRKCAEALKLWRISSCIKWFTDLCICVPPALKQSEAFKVDFHLTSFLSC